MNPPMATAQPAQFRLWRPPEPAAQLDTAIGACDEHQPPPPQHIGAASAARGR
jgi:hypothetical protein